MHGRQLEQEKLCVAVFPKEQAELLMLPHRESHNKHYTDSTTAASLGYIAWSMGSHLK